MRIAFIFFYVGRLYQNANADNGASRQAPRPGIDFIGPLWLPRTYKVTCCRGGQPMAENAELITNWTQKASDYAVDEHALDGGDDHCRVFEGTFLLSASALFNFSFTGYGVQCKCPDHTDALDRHCRRLAPCQNNGYRSQSLGMMCACTEPYFGEFCDKICDQGQVLKGVDGRSYCSCLPFYQGEQCTDMVCLNGGVEVHGRCTCPPTFVGYHCEVDANRTIQHGTRFHRFGESNELLSRDISGTVFSLVMIIVLVVSMYLLMKHRMQVQSRFAASRREEMARAAAAYGISRRGDVIAPEDLRIAPFVAAGIDGPPPYVLHTYTSTSICKITVLRVRRNTPHGVRHPASPSQATSISIPIDFWRKTAVVVVVHTNNRYVSKSLPIERKRLKVQSRFAASRREEMARAAAAYGISRRGDVIAPEDLRIAPFVAAGIDGPPPYVLHTYTSRMRTEILPPLPSYEDATKEPPIR
ncbi:hypothetical protein Y032_0025g1273 [Ancylostoma ceylanicum]|nr:hypothetical protein Y032_0025g1273 [Ancylostoma ceylanicum]